MNSNFPVNPPGERSFVVDLFPAYGDRGMPSMASASTPEQHNSHRSDLVWYPRSLASPGHSQAMGMVGNGTNSMPRLRRPPPAPMEGVRPRTHSRSPTRRRPASLMLPCDRCPACSEPFLGHAAGGALCPAADYYRGFSGSSLASSASTTNLLLHRQSSSASVECRCCGGWEGTHGSSVSWTVQCTVFGPIQYWAFPMG